jgi:hypothetical protein
MISAALDEIPWSLRFFLTNDKLLISSVLLTDEFSVFVESKVICSSQVTLVEILSTAWDKTQLPRFASWKPDPESEFIDAFSFQWKTEFCYLFPPFSLISRCVQTLVREEAEVLIIVLLWPTQIWYTQL